MLRSEAMAKKIRGVLGAFEEMDLKEAHRNRRFLRLKVKIDLKNLLKRGTIVRFKDKNLHVHLKYERLPTFYFICGRLGHQLKYREAAGDLTEDGFEDLEEQIYPLVLGWGHLLCLVSNKSWRKRSPHPVRVVRVYLTYPQGKANVIC